MRNDVIFDFFVSNVGPLHLKQIAIDFVFRFGQVVRVPLKGTSVESVLLKFE